ncbi:MAG: hypothetical protein IT377_18805 [Polyangiaceae bacterium]|nr:hypothetical protein [Polyangiaceae bacterium]
MRAQRLLHALAVCLPLAVIGSCGGSTDSDPPRDGGHDASLPDAANEAGHDGGSDADASDAPEDGSDEDAQPDAVCVCPLAPPQWEETCACAPLDCTYCNAAKWELTSASCKGGKWKVMIQWDTPCGDN